MDKLFLTVLKMSITSSYVILFVLVARLLLKKSPKIFSYMLWAVVLFRLICPISFESKLSLIPNFTKSELNLSFNTPVNNISKYSQYNITSYFRDKDGTTIDSTPVDTTSNNAEKEAINNFNFTYIISVIWLTAISIMILYSIFSLIKLKKRLKDSKYIKDNIYESENIDTAFVIGVFNPKIYIQKGLSKNEEQYILAHERIHIKRYDYLIKLVSYLTLCIHCFNPLVWISFMLMSKDMEMSCDEAVMKEMGNGIKKEYSKSLLSFATNNRSISISPTAFGEGDVKSRIKNILNYKKPSFWAVIISAIVVIGVVIGLTANPVNNEKIEGYLNIDNALENTAKMEEIIIRTTGEGDSIWSEGGSIWSGEGFIENFRKQTSEIKWNEVKGKSDLSEDITIYIYKNNQYTVRFFESEPKLVKVTYDGKSKYWGCRTK